MITSLSAVWLFTSIAGAAPATVLEHTIKTRIDSRQRLRESITWSVRIDDPAACEAGIIAPPGLDGASTEAGAIVLEDVLLVPSDTKKGDVFTLTASRRAPTQAHSGVHLSAPDLPTERVHFEVTLPSRDPLTVWGDSDADSTVKVSRGSRTVVMDWTDLSETEGALLSWSTHSDWTRAGAALKQTVKAKLAPSSSMPRHLATGLEGLGAAGIVEAAYKEVALIPGNRSSFESARPAAQVLAAKEGTAAERALVLISLFQQAKLSALPVYFRSPTDRGQFPVTVPAPTTLTRPGVLVATSRGSVLIDPASEYTQIPDRPASMLGATVWNPNELPTPLREEAVDDGQVDIQGEISLAPNGAASWTATISASGAAREYLRNLLAPLNEAARTEAIKKRIHTARPKVDGLTVRVTGAEKVTKELMIKVAGNEENALNAKPYGLTGNIPALIAPALASWLPPNITIREETAIKSSPGVQLLGSALADPAFEQSGMITRSLDQDASKVAMTTTAIRPYRTTTPALTVDAGRFMKAQAQGGVEVMLLPSASKEVITAVLDDADRADSEKKALQALLLYRGNNDSSARKVLKKSLKSEDFEDIVAQLGRFVPSGEDRPFRDLLDLTRKDDAKRWVVVQALAERQSNPEDVIAFCEELAGSEQLSDEAKGEVALTALEVGASDQKWLAMAQQMLPNRDEVKIRTAQSKMKAGQYSEAMALIEPTLSQKLAPTTPPEERANIALATALAAQIQAESDGAVSEVRETTYAALAADPSSPQVAFASAHSFRSVKLFADAADAAITGARLAPNDPDGWMTAAEFAVQAGRLEPAIQAVTIAYGLSKDPVHLEEAKRLLKLAGDPDLAKRTLPKGMELQMPSLSQRMSNARPEELLAVLGHAESEVVAAPQTLAMRAQMRIDAGELDLAARDAMLLYTRHGWGEGASLAFAATAGRQISPTLVAQLNQAARQATPRLTRMEYRLITLNGDALSDAKALADDPRSQIVLKLASSPQTLAQDTEYDKGAKDPGLAAPSGYAVNALLGAVQGLKAFSHPEGAKAVLVSAVKSDKLPPPLQQLYDAEARLLERLPNGGEVRSLQGGLIPLYTASEVRKDLTWFGLGFTPEAAKRALADSRD